MENEAGPDPAIVALPADLIFGSRIREAAIGAGVDVALARSATDAERRVTPATRLLIVDLDSRSGNPVDLIRRVRQRSDAKEVHILAYVSHVREDAIDAAREAGADRVLARGAFARQVVDLLREYAKP